MAVYVLIETRTTLEHESVGDFLDLAGGLADQGAHVDLFLIQNGALMARVGIEQRIEQLLQRPNVTVWADDFSLERQFTPVAVSAGVRVGSADTLVQLLAQPGCTPIWH